MTCDWCGASKGTRRRTLRRLEGKGTSQFTFDICARCASTKTLDEIEEHAPQGPRNYEPVVTEAYVERAAKVPGTRR